MNIEDIHEGKEYIYTCGIPAGCIGHRYKVHRHVLDVPAYQTKVLVEALTGKDRGSWFTCSLANFAVRHRPVEPGDNTSDPE